MNAEDVQKRIAELAGMRDDPKDDPIAQVETALFVEEVFGLRLSDDDMTSEKLGTMEAITHTVIDRLGVK